MAAFVKSRPSRKHRSRRARVMTQKINGIISPRVQKVGPQHFGIVCVDCGKARSKWMLTDFYGKVLIDAQDLVHARGHFEVAVARVREALQTHDLRDVIVAIERTGNYHLPVKRAFQDAGFETRIVHPFATKQFRQPANPGNKTDETDLAAILRATCSGFGLIETPLDETSQALRHLVRHRRDLVQKRTAVYCQIREHLEAVLPGYAACFDNLWNSQVALEVPRLLPTTEAIAQAGVAGLSQALRGRRFQNRTLENIVTWARMAAAADPAAPIHRKILLALDEDRQAKTGQIQALERDIAGLLVQTPYVLLLSHPGICVVSAGELAGEMGPITHYANAKCITGRAGLFPSRYQSADVDRSGSLVRCSNRNLRAILMMIAANLVLWNHHFRALAERWKTLGMDARHTKVRVASRFARIAFQIVSGRQVFCHPSGNQRDYILDKLMKFHRDHHTPPAQMLPDLQAAIDQIPRKEYGAEAIPLHQELQNTRTANKRGPQPIGELLPILLAKLGVGNLQSNGDQGPG